MYHRKRYLTFKMWILDLGVWFPSHLNMLLYQPSRVFVSKDVYNIYTLIHLLSIFNFLLNLLPDGCLAHFNPRTFTLALSLPSLIRPLTTLHLSGGDNSCDVEGLDVY